MIFCPSGSYLESCHIHLFSLEASILITQCSWPLSVLTRLSTWIECCLAILAWASLCYAHCRMAILHSAFHISHFFYCKEEPHSSLTEHSFILLPTIDLAEHIHGLQFGSPVAVSWDPLVCSACWKPFTCQIKHTYSHPLWNQSQWVNVVNWASAGSGTRLFALFTFLHFQSQ